MHYIQKHVLDNLRRSDSMHYAELNKDEVETGHFRYHLNQLIADGLVEQVARGEYKLTTKGQQLVDYQSEQFVKSKKAPKLIVYVLLRNGDKLYLQEKNKEPYRGLLNFIGGKIHFGETAEEAALRAVSNKAKLDLDSLEEKGVVEVRINNEGLLLTHAIAFVFVKDIDLKKPSDHNLVEVVAPSMVAQDLAPDLKPILELIDAGSKFVGAIDTKTS